MYRLYEEPWAEQCCSQSRSCEFCRHKSCNETGGCFSHCCCENMCSNFQWQCSHCGCLLRGCFGWCRPAISLKGLTGHVILQGEPGYNKARQDFNGRFNKFPKIIVYCEAVDDVVNAICWVRKYGLPFRIRDGGHSYEAFSLVNCGLIIDVSRLLNLQINKEEGTARVGAGIKLLPLYEALWEQGVTIPGGTCPTVGISGLTLGGGYGVLSRLFGMTCDNLLEIEMVTAHGNMIRANRFEHPDLFWACRGGGDGSFGVITSFTFRVHPIETVTTYSMTWDFNDVAEVVRHWQMWAPYTDERLTSLLSLPGKGQGDLSSFGAFVGPEEELKLILRPLQENTQPKSVELQTMTWIEAVHMYAGIPQEQALFKNTSAYVSEPLSNAALDVLNRNLGKAPGPTNRVSFAAYGGAINRVPTMATAFPHRKTMFAIQYQSYWTQDEEACKNIRWIEQFRVSMLPFTRGAYRNYCDSMIADWPIAYFGVNLSRLKKAKRMYDPENLFHFEQSIPIN